MKLKKEIIQKTYREKNVLIEVEQFYHYDSEVERTEHKCRMEELRYNTSGQVKDNIGTIFDPKYVWCAWYNKWYVESIDIKGD